MVYYRQLLTVRAAMSRAAIQFAFRNVEMKANQRHKNSRGHASTTFYRALDFAAAADACAQVYGKDADFYTMAYLLAHALELALKSALLADGVSIRDLASRKKFGHNLLALVRECDRRSITMVDPSIPDTKWGLKALNDAYLSKELQYQERGVASSPSIVLLRKLVHFALHRAGEHALRPEVLAMLLDESSGCPGITLLALPYYARI
jgi:hypothetical protein